MSNSSVEIARLVANLTHELKTPLHSIVAVASVLSSEVDGTLNTEQKRQVEIISRNSELLLEMINELLEFSSATSGTRKLQIKRIDLKDLLNQIVGTFVPVAEKSGINFEHELKISCPSFYTDVKLLRTIVSNLLGNAFKFCGSNGSVSFFAECVEEELRFHVADSGIGMSRVDAEAIFKDFYQVDAGDTRQYGGVGLGLSLVRKSLEMLTGTVDVKSEEGRGTIFSVLLPSLVSLRESSRIAVVSDDNNIRLGLKECFRAEDLDAQFFSNVPTLMAEVVEFKPQVLLFDVSADSSEVNTLVGIKQIPFSESCPIIVMTSNDTASAREELFKMGVNDVLVKPFSAGELVARIKRELLRQ